MAIDAHVHLLAEGFMHDRWWDGLGRTMGGRLAARGERLPASPLAFAKQLARARARAQSTSSPSSRARAMASSLPCACSLA